MSGFCFDRCRRINSAQLMCTDVHQSISSPPFDRMKTEIKQFPNAMEKEHDKTQSGIVVERKKNCYIDGFQIWNSGNLLIDFTLAMFDADDNGDRPDDDESAMATSHSMSFFGREHVEPNRVENTCAILSSGISKMFIPVQRIRSNKMCIMPLMFPIAQYRNSHGYIFSEPQDCSYISFLKACLRRFDHYSAPPLFISFHALHSPEILFG